MHAGEDLHRHVARIVADKLLVNFQDAFQLAVERLAVDVREVKIDHGLAVDAQVVLVNHFVDVAGGDVTRHQVAVFRIPFFQKVPALVLRNAFPVALVAFGPGHPDAAAFAARRFRHQPQLVFARECEVGCT